LIVRNSRYFSCYSIMANPPDTESTERLPRRRSLPIVIPQSPIPHFRAPPKSKYPNLGSLIQDHDEEDKILRESKEQSEGIGTMFQQRVNAAAIQIQETDLLSAAKANNKQVLDNTTEHPARAENSPQQSNRSSGSRSVSIPGQIEETTANADIEGHENGAVELCLAQEAFVWQSKLLKICNIYPADCAAH